MATAIPAMCTRAMSAKQRPRAVRQLSRVVAVVLSALVLASFASPVDAGARLQTCASSTPTVTVAAELDAAIVCWNNQTPVGDHTITFGADFAHAGSTPNITQDNTSHSLAINGGGHTLTGPGADTLPGAKSLFTIYGEAPVTVDAITLTDADGAAIQPRTGSDVTITNTSLEKGTWGVFNNGGTVELSNSTIADNESFGVFTDGPFVISNSVITNNTQRGVTVNGGAVVISHSIVKNSDYGIYAAGGSVLVSNSTVTTNPRTGVFTNGASVLVSNSTISNNDSGIEFGNAGGSIEAVSSIVAGNEFDECFGTGSVIDGGNNFFEDSSCGASFTILSPAGSGSLAALAGNGGPTETHALLAGSNAIDAGDCTNVAIGSDSGGSFVNGDLAFDQRGGGFPRTLGIGCDAGAFEAPGYLLQRYVAMNPARILDSRAALQVGAFGTPWGSGQLRQVAVTGVGGVPASGVDAVVINVTTVSPSAGFSWLTISPTGDPPGVTAVHNFGTDSYTTELSNDVVIAKVGSGGTIDIRNNTGTVDLVIDVVGYYTSTGAGYVALNPARILDSRSGPLNQGPFATPWGSGQTRQVAVTDIGGVPASGVDAVVINVTTVSPSAGFSWLTVTPTGEPAGTTAVHNFGTDPYTTELVNDVVIAKVGSGGTIDIRNQAGTVDLVIDVVGYYSSSGGDGYTPLNPSRILDTRNSSQGDYDTPWGAGQTRDVETTFDTCATAVVLHVTSVDPTAVLSWLTVAPAGVAAGTTAAHNFGTASYTSEIANDLVIAKTGTDGNINIRNETGTVDLVIDLVGYYGLCVEIG